MAEYLLRQWLGPDTPWVVRSAGVAAPDGMPASESTRAALAEQGIDATGHRSRLLDEGLVDAADLIVVMTADHRRIVLQRFPGARGKVFTLRSFGHAGCDADIEDPIGLSTAGYRTIRNQIDSAISDLVLHLRGLRPTRKNKRDGERT